MLLGKSPELILGNLELIYPSGESVNYLATSGLPNWQRIEDQWTRGKGPIPAGEYQIPSEAYWLETRGVEGLFYHITPDPVGSGNKIRSELGIHYDANTREHRGVLDWLLRKAAADFAEEWQKLRHLEWQAFP